MKSLRFSILSGVAVAVCLAIVLLVIDYTTRTRIEESVRDILNDLSLPLLEQDDPSALYGKLDVGVDLLRPDMSFLPRYLPLLKIGEWEGEVFVPSFFTRETPQAQLTARVNYLRGLADVRATLVYRDGEWLIREYVVIQGLAAR